MFGKKHGSFLIGILLFCGALLQAQTAAEKNTAVEWIKQNEAKAKEINQRIWNLAELGLAEN